MRAGKRAGLPWVVRGDYSPGEHAATQWYGFFSVSNQAQKNPRVPQTRGPRWAQGCSRPSSSVAAGSGHPDRAQGGIRVAKALGRDAGL